MPFEAGVRAEGRETARNTRKNRLRILRAAQERSSI